MISETEKLAIEVEDCTHPAPQQKPLTEYKRAVMHAALSCVELQEKDPATMFKMIVEGVERFHNIGEKK